MKIEAVDPLNLASICVATVTKVLRFGYIMIRFALIIFTFFYLLSCMSLLTSLDACVTNAIFLFVYLLAFIYIL